MEIGSFYHIYNGYAKNLDNLWLNNSELVGITQHHNGLIELEFVVESGETIVIDYELMTPWNPSRIRYKGYMFIKK
jgi:hypothetical protein